MAENMRHMTNQDELANWPPSKRLTLLLQEEHEVFIVNAYRIILRRIPDPDGMRHFLGRLSQGDAKIQIINSIRSSQEGRYNSVSIPGLMLAYLKFRIASMPIVGPIYSQFVRSENNGQIAISIRRTERAVSRSERLREKNHSALEMRLSELYSHIIAIAPINGQATTKEKLEENNRSYPEKSSILLDAQMNSESIVHKSLTIDFGSATEIMERIREHVALTQEARLLSQSTN